MSSKPNLYIPMEVKARELEGRTLLALEAATRGFRVVLGHKTFITKAIIDGIFPKGIYYYKDFSKASENQLQSVYSKGFLVSGQDEESGLLTDDYRKFIAYRSTDNTVDMATAIFCWGTYDSQYWKEYYSEHQSKIFPTGSPRIDLWRPDFKKYFSDTVLKIKEKYHKIVLIPSTFTQANNYLSIEDRIIAWKNANKIKTVQDEENLRKYIDDSIKMFHCFVDLVNILASEFKDVNFIIRPHPSENMSGWRNAVKNAHNIHVVFEYGISNWVHASQAVLHNGCTTGIEAYVADVPVIAYKPFQSDAFRPIPNKLSNICTSVEEVAQILTKVFKNMDIYEYKTYSNDILVNNRMINLDGDTAAKRIVDVLERMDLPHSPPFKMGLWSLKMSLLKKIGYIRLLKDSKRRGMRKFPGLYLQELLKIKANLCRVDQKYEECKVRKLLPNVFIIEKE